AGNRAKREAEDDACGTIPCGRRPAAAHVSGARGAIAVPFAPAIASGTAAADTSVTRALC
ncbi:MAG: hypothetical protein WCD87_18395, partial [Pseudolabrys sp.]